jgi:hypothetical protein
VPEYFTPLTLDLQTGVVSTEDTVEIRVAAREVAIEKVRGRLFFLNVRGPVIIESHTYFQDMWEVAEKQHAPILTGLRALAVDREWEVEVVPLVVGPAVRSRKRSGWKPSRSLGSGRRTARGSMADLVTLSSTSMRNFSAATGGTHWDIQ